jgi:hypothetical protein
LAAIFFRGDGGIKIGKNLSSQQWESGPDCGRHASSAQMNALAKWEMFVSNAQKGAQAEFRLIRI